MMYQLGPLVISLTMVNWTYSQQQDMCAGNDTRIKHHVRLNVSGDEHCLFQLHNQTTALSTKQAQAHRITCVDFEEARRLCNEHGAAKLLQIDSVDLLDAVIEVAPQFGDLQFPIGVQKIKRIPLYATDGKQQRIDFAKVVWDGGYTMNMNSSPYDEITDAFYPDWWQWHHEFSDRFIVIQSCKRFNSTCAPVIMAFNVSGQLRLLENNKIMVVCHQHPDYPLGQSPPNQCDIQDNVEKAKFTVDNKQHCVFRLVDEDAFVDDKRNFTYNKTKADTACNAKHARLPQITSVPVFRALVKAVHKFKTCSEYDVFVQVPLGIKEIKEQHSKKVPAVIKETVSMVLDNGKTIDTKMLNASADFTTLRPFALLFAPLRQFVGHAFGNKPATVICHQSEWTHEPGETTPTGQTEQPGITVQTGQTGPPGQNQTGPPEQTDETGPTGQNQTGPPEQTGQSAPPGQTGQTGQTGHTGHTPPPEPGKTTAEPPHQAEQTTTTGVRGIQGNAWVINGLIAASVIMVGLGK